MEPNTPELLLCGPAIRCLCNCSNHIAKMKNRNVVLISNIHSVVHIIHTRSFCKKILVKSVLNHYVTTTSINVFVNTPPLKVLDLF